MIRSHLVDRAHRMAKRHGQWARVMLDDTIRATPPVGVDELDLDVALARLAAFDSRKSQLAELRFFGGWSLAEVGRDARDLYGDRRALLVGDGDVVIKGAAR
jgi:ECF sigma factor